MQGKKALQSEVDHAALLQQKRMAGGKLTDQTRDQ
jgi:hypothetical protein